MRGNTKRLALAAMLTALETALLYLSGILPGGRLGLAALAGILNAAALMECGRGWAWLAYVASAGLGLLVCPLKGPPLVYLVFFGYYPILKSTLERIHWRWLCWLVKLSVFALAAGLAFLLYSRALLQGITLPDYALALVAALGAAAFVVYDLALSGLIQTYITRKIRR